jgi:hypothetical protein
VRNRPRAAKAARKKQRKLFPIKVLSHVALKDSMWESFFSYEGALAGGIRKLSFFDEAAQFPYTAEGSQCEHFHDPGLTASPAMLLYRPKLRI